MVERASRYLNNIGRLQDVVNTLKELLWRSKTRRRSRPITWVNAKNLKIEVAVTRLSA
jgi:hypothetical protein